MASGQELPDILAFASRIERYIGSRISLCPKRLCTAPNAASFWPVSLTVTYCLVITSKLIEGRKKVLYEVL